MYLDFYHKFILNNFFEKGKMVVVKGKKLLLRKRC